MSVSNGRGHASLQLPFIFLKAQNEPANPENKIPFPKTVEQLQRASKKKLRLRVPPATLAFFDEEGEPILDVSDITPGSLLTVRQFPPGRTSFPGMRRKKISGRTQTPSSAAGSGHKIPGDDDSYDNEDGGGKPAKLYDEEDDEDFGPSDPEKLKFGQAGIGLLSGILPGDLLSGDLGPLLNSLPKNAVALIENAQRVEQQQSEFWRQNVAELAKSVGLAVDLESVLFLDKLRAKASEIIEEHLILGTLGYTFTSQLVLGGPGRSGKTTFFAVFVEQLFIALDRCELRKKVFLMVINCDHLAVAALDPKSLHSKWFEVVLSSFVAQVPALTGHQATLQKYFDGIVENSYLPLLPKRFLEAPGTQGIAKSIVTIATVLSAHWNNSDLGSSWASLLFLFPVLLAKELGFQDVLFLVDNFDSINITLKAGPQFESPDLFLSEHFKVALSSAQFVLSYHDPREFDNSLVPFDDGLIDFSLTLEYHSVLEVECEPSSPDYEIIVDIGTEQLKIRAEHVSTAPGYLQQWNILNQMCDQRDENNDSSDEAQELLASVLSHAETILPLVFQSDYGFGEVEDVRRRKNGLRKPVA
jgi:hypothetical protein